MPLWMVRKILTSTLRSFEIALDSNESVTISWKQKLTSFHAVKFEGDTLPSILNALETDNGGNKLILEVAVCQAYVSRGKHKADITIATFG